MKAKLVRKRMREVRFSYNDTVYETTGTHLNQDGTGVNNFESYIVTNTIKLDK